MQIDDDDAFFKTRVLIYVLRYIYMYANTNVYIIMFIQSNRYVTFKMMPIQKASNSI